MCEHAFGRFVVVKGVTIDHALTIANHPDFMSLNTVDNGAGAQPFLWICPHRCVIGGVEIMDVCCDLFAKLLE